MGYYRAGFDVTGIDIKKQPHYPAFHNAEYAKHFKFHLADALTFPLDGYDAYHASPPCQFASMATRQWRQAGREYVNLIPATRDRLLATGRPYVIENVVGSPYLSNPTKLNGAFFDLPLRRTRYFETSFTIPMPLLPSEPPSRFRMGRPPPDGLVVPVGHFSGVERARRVMGIDWMTRDELTQAIPPCYTCFIGGYLLSALSAGRSPPSTDDAEYWDSFNQPVTCKRCLRWRGL